MIELYKIRTFSEKISDTIDFIRQNWRALLKYLGCVILPASIVLAFFFNHFWNGYMSFVSDVERGTSGDFSDGISFMLNYVAMVVIYMVTFVFLNAMFYAMVRVYYHRENGLQGVVYDELRSPFKLCLKRMATLIGLGFLLGIVVIVALVVVGALFGTINAALVVLYVLLCGAALFAVAFPLMLMAPIYMLEDNISFFDALAKAMRLGFKTWGGIFGMAIVLGLLISVLQMVTSGPWYVLFIMKTIFTLSNDLDGSFTNSFIFTLITYLASILQCMGMLISTIFTEVGMNIQYGHAAELVDGMGTQEKIEHFEDL